MISKTRRRCIAAGGSVALRDNRLCAGESRHPRAEGRVRARRLQTLRWLHSRPHQGRAVPEAEQVRSQRRVPIGVRTKRRPGGQQKQITESAAQGARPRS